MSNLVGNAPNQVPTNADLGDLAYQDADYVRAGNVTIDGNINANAIVSAGSESITVYGNLTSYGNLTTNGNITTDGNIISSNVITTNDITVTSGNIFINSANLSSFSNTVVTRGYIDTQLIVFGI